MLIPIIKKLKTISWPQLASGNPDKIEYVSMEEAMSGNNPIDACTTQYYSPVQYRLNHSAIGKAPITMQLIVFDIDHPEKAKYKESKLAIPEDIYHNWLLNEQLKMKDLFNETKPICYYNTNNGYRIVFELKETRDINDAQDAHKWSLYYLSCCNYLERTKGIICDKACKDFTRMFRLPKQRGIEWKINGD